MKAGIMEERYKREAAIMKVLAHPARLAILEELGRGPHTVSELHSKVGVDLSTLSRHLSLLKSAGLVEDRREGNKVYYRVLVSCALDFFQCCKRVIEERRRISD